MQAHGSIPEPGGGGGQQQQANGSGNGMGGEQGGYAGAAGRHIGNFNQFEGANQTGCFFARWRALPEARMCVC